MMGWDCGPGCGKWGCNTDSPPPGYSSYEAHNPGGYGIRYRKKTKNPLVLLWRWLFDPATAD